MRGLVQGWPKQIGSTRITRACSLPSKANPGADPSGMFGATLSVKGRRLITGHLLNILKRSDKPTSYNGYYRNS
jgi:hypothetical protein